jgi:two-component system response regulator GlrR
MPLHTVLIIDDDRLTRWSMSMVLGRAGYRVEEAASGEGGMSKIPEAGPVVVLADIALPDMDGFAVLRAIHARHPALPVILMSADATAAMARDAMRKGAFAWLDKPCDPMELETVIARAVRSAETSDQKPA